MRAVVGLAAIAFLVACDAVYTDLRPEDGLDPDGGGLVGPPVDAGGTPGTEQLIARGTFEGRAGHLASGEATLFRYDNGALELRFDDSFMSSSAPGPVVILSDRTELGAALDPMRDRVLGRQSAFTRAQIYPVPGEDEGLRVAWIWCRPFEVEIGRAILTEVE